MTPRLEAAPRRHAPIRLRASAPPPEPAPTGPSLAARPASPAALHPPSLATMVRRALAPARPPAVLAALLCAGWALLALPAAAATPCERSARQARKACGFDARDDFWESKAICTHIGDADDRADCLADAGEERDETEAECQEIYEFRLDYCEASGEDRYDPDFRGANFNGVFDDTNPYWLLTPGHEWVLESEDETVVVRVLPATKRVGGVDCIVVNDVVSEDGELIEDTDDWFAIANNGDVWYCGENAKDYEYFRGDAPQEAELVSIDGSFKHGVEGAKAGIVMFGAPAVGQIYRQEFSLANAEDGAEVLSTTYSFGDGGGLDRRVPQELAELFCDGDCVVTREFNLNEPGVEARKYYAPGVGVFLEVEGREVVRLVGCNMDPRCDELEEL
ncbi:MAG: hypothetical protein R3325_00745 [Thermoanaerobaculia bacterium]|nr:hypothetical protein [Thermoanaerobaculia bacterium]